MVRGWGRATGVALAMALTIGLNAAPAMAQSRDENWRRCGEGDADLSIGACTTIIQSGRETNKGLADAFYNRGIAYNRKGEYDRAIQDYDQALRLNPSDAEVFNNRGNTYQRKGAYDRAIQDYDQAIRLNLTFAFAHNGRGAAYELKGQLARALEDYERAIRFDPAYAVARDNRCKLLVKLGRPDPACPKG